MPFFDDTGVKSEDHHGPFWSTLVTFFEQIERIILLNVGFALQLVPLAAFFVFPELVWPVRIILLLYTVVVFPPALGLLFGMVRRIQQGEMLRMDMLPEVASIYGLRSLLVLGPLYSLFAWMAGLIVLADYFQFMALDVLLQLAFLFTGVFALYWGPIFAEHPEYSASKILCKSVRLFWKYPLISPIATGIVLMTWMLGLITIIGMVLLAPALSALFQTGYYQSVLLTKHSKVTE